MTFKVTYEPLSRIEGPVPTTVEFESAADAYRAVDRLMRSDERVTITEDGRRLSWQHLMELAVESRRGLTDETSST